MTRTPTEHRAAADEWRATAPANDSDILPRAGRSSGRHGSLSEQLTALMAFRNRPAGIAEEVPAEPASPIATNWRIQPANDNKVPADGFGIERAVEITPSIGEIQRAMAEVIFEERPVARFGKGRREKEPVPVGGDIGRNGAGAIVRLGRLTFSDGAQMEKCLVLNEIGRVVKGELRLPVGAMLGCREKSTRDKGGAPDTADVSASNSYFAEVLGARLPTLPKMKPRKQSAVRLSKADERAMLAEAYSNTPVLPPVKKYSPGLPAGPASARDLFVGMKKAPCAEDGGSGWEDIATAIADRDEWARTRQRLADEHIETLTAATSASSLRQLGERAGYRGQHAVDAGRRLLIAANDNLQQAMKLSA